MNRISHAVAVLLFCSVFSSQAQELSQRTADQVHRIYQLEQDGDLAGAIARLEKLKPSAGYDQAYVARMLGIYYWQAEQPEQAQQSLTQALEVGGLGVQQDWDTRGMLAEILMANEQVDQAMTHFELMKEQLISQAAAGLAPSQSQLQRFWNNLSYGYYQQQQWPQVLTALTQLEALETLNVSALSMRLSAQLQLNQLKGSIVTSKQLLALEPNKLIWWQQLSSLYSQTQQHQLALATLVQAERAGIELPETLLKHQAQLYAYLGVPEKAAQTYQGLPEASTDKQLLIRQAQLWQQAREWQQAATYWQQVAKLETEYYYELARVHLLAENYPAALQALELLDPQQNNSKALLLRVQVHVDLKQYQQAWDLAQKAHAKAPQASTKQWIAYLSALMDS